MLRLEIKNRFDTKSSVYFKICRDNYQSYEKYCSSDIAMRQSPRKESLQYWSGLFRLQMNMSECNMIATIFGALCLESFIYDYAAIHFSDTYTRNYLEKVGFISKWVIIPKLVTGKDFPTASQAFAMLKKLKKTRDDLVHAKSKSMPTATEIKKMLDEGKKLVFDLEKGVKQHMLNPYQTVIDVLTELRNLEDELEYKCWELVKVRKRSDYLKD